MKSSITTLALALLTAAGIVSTTTDAVAQGRARTGIKGGLSASTLQFNEVDFSNRKERIGFHAGVFTQIPVGSAFAIQPELLYVNKGASSNYRLLGQDSQASFNLNYIDLPVLATLKLGDAVEIQAGPYAGYLLNSNVSNTGGIVGNSAINLNADQFNRVDYGLAGGLNVYFGQVLLGVRYTQGLQKIANTTASQAIFSNAKNGVGLLSIGYSFN
ncbi:porin family protein [Fibrella forsythiae]|uniref:PorT family protein n=1 Tax=Fibrella forsythiae TaxID=2817061 RepID=A0ABS3JQ19_9BACT|nr:porin family protein [Fibrella forsythiae]MBO0952083.1 PorT family protein [Fibrella forsythiae]